MGVANRYRCVAPHADLTDQLPQAAAIKLQVKTHLVNRKLRTAPTVTDKNIKSGGN